MRTPCIICYKPSKPNPGGSTEHQHTLKTFFRLFGRYLDGDKSGNETDKNIAQGHLENIINGGMIACEDCSKTVASFCDLYHQMKILELRVNWIVKIFNDTIFVAERVPDGIQDFKKCAEQLDLASGEDTSEIIKSVIGLKRNLREKCDLKLRTSCPRLKLQKSQVQRQDIPSDMGPLPIDFKMEDDFADDERLLSNDDLDEYPVSSDLDDRAPGNEPESAKALEIETIGDAEATSKINPKTGKHKCNRCTKEFRYFETCRAHYLAVHLVKYKCKICQKRLSSRRQYIRHHRNKHLGPQFNCPHCKKRFKNESALHDHNPPECKKLREKRQVHLKLQRFKCEICQKVYTRNTALEFHLIKAHSKPIDPKIRKVHICDTCGKCFAKPNNLREHVKSVHLGIREHFCDTCGKGFSTNCNLKLHVRVVHLKLEKPVCELCGKMFSSNSHLSGHKKAIHFKVDDFPCDNCGRKFSQMEFLVRHQKGSCKPQEYACDKCEKKFATPKTLTRHVKSVHLQLLKYKCDLCEKSYTRKDSLYQHLKRDHLIAANKCNLCEEEFSGERKLQLHLKTVHSKLPEPHICDTCGKSYPTSIKLREHIKCVHLRSREHVCETCGKGFFSNSDLKRHVSVVHLKLKEHFCDLCDKNFSRSSHLQSHRLKVHGNVGGKI